MSGGEVPVYLPGGAHTSSSIGRFVNYFGPSPDMALALRECEERVGEPCVILNGSDDWGCERAGRPEWFDREGVLPPGRVVAHYHSGTSGITRSGIIIRLADLDALRVEYAVKWGAWRSYVTVHTLDLKEST